MSSPGFPGSKQRVPGYSLLASSRVLGPKILTSTKVLLVPVTNIDEREFVLASAPGFSKRGTTLKCHVLEKLPASGLFPSATLLVADY